MNSEAVRAQIERLTVMMVECSLCDEQSFPSIRLVNGHTLVSVAGGADLSVALKSNFDYRQIYTRLEETRAFNFRMLDGAMVQLLYDFMGDELVGHRLSYFPSPSLEPFQNEPELYEHDEIYADILSKNVVPFPLRFDYSSDEGKHVDLHHPKSHLTLGQYQNCRMPVSAPLTPAVFARFLLKNFYNTAYCAYEAQVPLPNSSFPDCISDNEREIPHLLLAQRAA